MLSTNSAFSQPLIEELQRLNFGTLAVPDNSSVSRFTYPHTDRNLIFEGQLVLISRGTPGRYRFTDFPAFTSLSVTVTTTSLTTGVSSFPESMTVDSFLFDQLTTDAQGEAELSLGGRLSTSGSGNAYVDAPYSGTTTLRVEYWQPEVNALVFNSTTIDVDAELRSTITLIEDQELNFGTLFARTSSTDQASLTLAPTGSYSVIEPGNSRLVVLARPEQGIIRIVGAAPFYRLTITPQATDVLLEHTEFPESAPHFILSPLLTSPDDTATADANGELEIAIGGTLTTELTTSAVIYPSGDYEGTYQFTVSY
ncbi:MAG: DUF4402 domain-containing protein [Granulosicoccus sp.]